MGSPESRSRSSKNVIATVGTRPTELISTKLGTEIVKLDVAKAI
jgi:hypothetical protein